MQLPPQIREEIELLAERFPLLELRGAAEALRAGYDSGVPASHALSYVARVAYLLVRFPATYAACHRAFAFVAEVVADIQPRSMLDLGSGPGTAIIAARSIFPSLQSVEAVERDSAMALLSPRVVGNVQRRDQDLTSAKFGSADLVTMVYALGELASSKRTDVITRAWEAARQLFIVIEPGTPEGYERILRVREQLLGSGGHIVAPCPHAERCPMVGTKDWCHFAARVERTSLHRRLKGGSLGHEDEKFSYVAFSREPVTLPAGRIVRHPTQAQGHVRLQLCVEGKALRQEVVTRSNKSAYKPARKAEWGDAWPPILKVDAD